MDVSVVIPCFNHGHFIQEAIDSVLACEGITYEIIIVNDGSTDLNTLYKLNELEKNGFKIISHPNKGLGFTRNVGIRQAKGRYILPLDADNKIKPEYIYKAISLLESTTIDIVYANPIFFGEPIIERQFQSKPFDGLDLIYGNYIDACAIYRKEVWVQLNGYDENMPFNGYEDWEFWLHCFLRNFKFHHINESLYYYRIVRNSMIEATLGRDKENLNYEFMIKKHALPLVSLLLKLNQYSKMYEYDMARPLRSVFKYLHHSFKSVR